MNQLILIESFTPDVKVLFRFRPASFEEAKRNGATISSPPPVVKKKLLRTYVDEEGVVQEEWREVVVNSFRETFHEPYRHEWRTGFSMDYADLSMEFITSTTMIQAFESALHLARKHDLFKRFVTFKEEFVETRFRDHWYLQAHKKFKRVCVFIQYYSVSSAIVAFCKAQFPDEEFTKELEETFSQTNSCKSFKEFIDKRFDRLTSSDLDSWLDHIQNEQQRKRDKKYLQ